MGSPPHPALCSPNTGSTLCPSSHLQTPCVTFSGPPVPSPLPTSSLHHASPQHFQHIVICPLPDVSSQGGWTWVLFTVASLGPRSVPGTEQRLNQCWLNNGNESVAGTVAV